MLFIFVIDMNVVDKIVDGVEYIVIELDLLEFYGVWDEICFLRIFFVIIIYVFL